MSNSKITGALALVLIVGIALFFLWYAPRSTDTPDDPQTPASKDDLIVVESPLPNSEVGAPLTITGRARGNWYFEASFPVKIYDANGTLLGQAPAQALSDWMTTEYVPFSATLTFTAPQTETGTLVLEKDNASGLPEHANELRIPIRFSATSAPETTAVQLYYYNPELDQGPGGVQCSKNGLVAVERTIPTTQTPLRDVIQLLLKGELSSAERAQGLTTEFPLSGVQLTNATIENGVATLTFSDPENQTVGGSCRTGVLWAQIEETAKQFPTVQSVRFMPEELFQP